MVELSENTVYIIWAVAIIVFGIAEAATAQLVSIWFVIGAVAGLISAFCGANLYVQFTVFIAVSVLALVITRPLVKKYIKPKKENTNADRVLTQEGIVVEEINNTLGKGQVKVDGKLWTARSANGDVIPEGSIVETEKISGVKLIVKNKQIN
ncbi:MAG: NfeD family protein [Eubacterium sp.]